MIAGFFNGFANELGKEAAKKVVSLKIGFLKQARPTEAVEQLQTLQRRTTYLHAPVTTRQELQAILDKSLVQLRQSLSDHGYSGSEAGSITAKVEALLAADIDLKH